MMDIRLLGPIDLSHAGKRIPLARGQQALIVAILALEANRLVPRDRLLELLWGGQPPRKARAVLQTRVSELRTALRAAAATDLSAALETENSGYLLRIPDQSVDAHLFRTTVERSRQAASDEQARTLLRSALDLWRGPAFGGWSSDDAYAILCQGLEAARLTAMEELFDVELRLGNHRQVVDDIRDLSAANPDREQLVGQLMLALHRSGRTVESLQTYDRWRRWLADELGVDPGADVQSLYLAILHADPIVANGDAELSGEAGPSPTAAETGSQRALGRDEDGLDRCEAEVPRILPPDIADFSGRAHEVELLRANLTRRVGGVAIASVTGRGGVGKTALSIHVAHLLSNDFPSGQLYINLRGADKDTPVAPFVALGRFLQALGVEELPQTLEERSERYRGLLAARRILVILDNAATDTQVLPLIPGSPDCGTIISGRARLGATFGAHSVDLDVLRPEEAAELLRRIAGADRVEAEPEAATELGRRCGFLPLAVRIVAAKLAAKPHWNITKLVRLLEDERSRLDHLTHGHLDVRVSISLSFAGLDGNGQRLLRRLGDIDLPEIGVGVAAALLDADVEAAEQALERLFDSRLLDVAGHDCAGYARYRLHDLVRLFARERAMVDEPAQELYGARTRAFGFYLGAADEAYRSIFGGDFLTVHGTAPRWRADGKFAEELVADPTRWFETERSTIVAAVRRAADLGQVDACWDLMCTTSPLFPMRRYFDDWTNIVHIALVAVQRTGNARGEAAVRYRMGLLCSDQRDHEQASGHFARSAELFDHVGDRHGQAVATAHLAMIDRFLGRLTSALERYELALPGMQAGADVAGEAFALRGIGQVYMERGEFFAGETHIERALRLCRSLGGSRMGEAQALFWLGMLRLKQERYDDAQDIFADVLALTQKLGDPRGQAQALRGLGICYHHQGSPDRAMSSLGEALQLVRLPRPSLVESYVRRTIDELRKAG